jgi:hypothetical protein
VVQLAPAIREIELPNEPAVVGRPGIGVDDAERISLPILARGEQRDVRQRFGGCLARELG